MKYTKIRNVKSPEIGTGMSAGIDLFIPTIDSKFIEKFRELNPHLFSNFFKRKSISAFLESGTIPIIGIVKIPTGIKFNFIDEFKSVLIAKDKSGMSTKFGYSYLGGVIDQDYQGEVIIALYQASGKVTVLNETDKFIQLLHIPIMEPMLNETSIDSLYVSGTDEIKTERGEGGFGSTDKEIKLDKVTNVSENLKNSDPNITYQSFKNKPKSRKKNKNV